MLLKRLAMSAVAGTLAFSTIPYAAYAADAVPANIAAAVADAARPDADKQRDVNRKPGESVAFSGIKPGDKVVDLLPGGGYFTRIFAKTVGPKGHVFAVMTPPPAGAPEEFAKRSQAMVDNLNTMAKDYGNVTILVSPLVSMKFPEPVDMIWTSQNYHDLHIAAFGTDIAAFNKAVFNALKPGGTYIVLDHAAAPGTTVEGIPAVHRIDEEMVKKEVLAAGFVLDGESNVLRNPADDHTKRVQEGDIRGHTDQFILKFRKPAK